MQHPCSRATAGCSVRQVVLVSAGCWLQRRSSTSCPPPLHRLPWCWLPQLPGLHSALVRYHQTCRQRFTYGKHKSCKWVRIFATSSTFHLNTCFNVLLTNSLLKYSLEVQAFIGKFYEDKIEGSFPTYFTCAPLRSEHHQTLVTCLHDTG